MAVGLGGTAAGGTVSVEIAGVTVQVTTTAGQSAADVMAALAAAINANPTLAALGVSATADAETPEVDAGVDVFASADPGLAEILPPVPVFPYAR